MSQPVSTKLDQKVSGVRVIGTRVQASGLEMFTERRTEPGARTPGLYRRELRKGRWNFQAWETERLEREAHWVAGATPSSHG